MGQCLKQTEQHLEQIAKVIHEELWQPWAKILVEQEPLLSEKRVNRWKNECFVPYEQLSEEMKEKDRNMARKILNVWYTDSS